MEGCINIAEGEVDGRMGGMWSCKQGVYRWVNSCFAVVRAGKRDLKDMSGDSL